MAFAEPLVEGLKRAGKNVTPESFMKAMETFKDWRGTGTPLTFTPTDHQGAKQVYFLQVQPDGTFKKLTDWIRITK
jgi:ABC-type branched-subunit amino acid transport system substrate-binding protein